MCSDQLSIVSGQWLNPKLKNTLTVKVNPDFTDEHVLGWFLHYYSNTGSPTLQLTNDVTALQSEDKRKKKPFFKKLS